MIIGSIMNINELKKELDDLLKYCPELTLVQSKIENTLSSLDNQEGKVVYLFEETLDSLDLLKGKIEQAISILKKANDENNSI